MSGSPTINRNDRSTSRTREKEGENILGKTLKDHERKRGESVLTA
jgi:hypothetical protein